MITSTEHTDVREKLETFGIACSEGVVLLLINFDTADTVD